MVIYSHTDVDVVKHLSKHIIIYINEIILRLKGLFNIKYLASPHNITGVAFLAMLALTYQIKKQN